MKLKEAVNLYQIERELELAERTRETYGYHARKFIGFVGEDEPVEKITPMQIRQYLAHVAEENSRRYASDNWIWLSSFYTWAEQALNIPHVLKTGRVKRPSFTKKQVQPYSDTEIKAMLKSVDNIIYRRDTGTVYTASRPQAYMHRAILLTLLDSGLRASELCDLTIADWEGKRGKIFVQHGKGDKERTVFVGNTCRRAIAVYLANRGKYRDTDPLFANSRNKELDRNNLRRSISSIAKAAGVKSATIHRFRHSFAVNFLRNGGNAKQLQDILGHADLKMVATYVQLAETDIEAAAEFSPADRMKL